MDKCIIFAYNEKMAPLGDPDYFRESTFICSQEKLREFIIDKKEKIKKEEISIMGMPCFIVYTKDDKVYYGAGKSPFAIRIFSEENKPLPIEAEDVLMSRMELSFTHEMYGELKELLKTLNDVSKKEAIPAIPSKQFDDFMDFFLKSSLENVDKAEYFF